MINSQDLQKLSNELGIDKFTILREFIQITFLNNLYSYPEAKKLVFKGGTALRFFTNSPRFSEDLDFTSNLSQEEIILLTNKVIKSLKTDFDDIEIKNMESISGISRKIYVGTDISSQKLTIKLDFSEREEVINSKIGIIKTNLPIISTTPIIYLDPEEIFAEKIRAISTRNKGRDLFDLWFLIQNNYKPSMDLIQKKLDFYKEKFNKNEITKKVSEWDEKQLINDINKFLPIKDRKIIPEIKRLALEGIKNAF